MSTKIAKTLNYKEKMFLILSLIFFLLSLLWRSLKENYNNRRPLVWSVGFAPTSVSYKANIRSEGGTDFTTLSNPTCVSSFLYTL